MNLASSLLLILSTLPSLAVSPWFELDSESGLNRLIWTTEPGRYYNLMESINLANWNQISGYPRVAEGMSMNYEFALNPGGKGFFQVVRLENPPPVVQTTLAPTEDSQVRDGTYASNNYGTAMVLEVKKDNSDYSREAYLKFDTASVTGSVTAAKLRIYCTLSAAASISIGVYSVASTGWTETGITWNNRPAPGATALATQTVTTSGTWYEFDVTSYVSSERSAGRNILALALKSGTTSSVLVSFNSRENAANQPQLVLTTGTQTTCGSASGGPTDNPVATKYGTAYPWTDSIKWSCVFNVNDYTGTAEQKFIAARDAAAAHGGGVVYFPAGSYNFDNDLYLKDGVVIRGETPSNNDAKQSTFNPGTQFNFPKYNPSLSGSGTANSTAFKKIKTTIPDSDSNIGVVNVDVNRAAVHLLAADANNATNQNMVIMGVRSNNVAEPDAGVPGTGQNAWQRWSYRFAANVKIQGAGNILVANNRLNDATTDNYEQPGYIVKNGTSNYTLSSPGQAVFNYTNHYAIEVNRSKSGYTTGATPANEPSLFRPGNVIRDNYVYKTMRIGISSSGQGLVIRDNVIRDQSGKQAWVDPTGKNLVGSSNTLENRGIDWSGSDVLVTNNDIQVYRHKLKGGTYLSVDGEGILIQECCGGTKVNGVEITNNTVNSYIGIYKMGDINNVTIMGNTVSKGDVNFPDLIYASANTNGGSFKATNVVIEDNQVSNGNIGLYGDVATGSGNSIKNNTTSTSGYNVKHSCEAAVSISGNIGFTVNACQ